MALYVYPPSAIVSIDSSLLATAANQVLEIAQLTDINTELDTQTSELQDINTELDGQSATLTGLSAKLASALVSDAHDYIEVTRVSGGAADGEIETVVYKTGGSGGTTVATLTLAYDVNGAFQTVTRT